MLLSAHNGKGQALKPEFSCEEEILAAELCDKRTRSVSSMCVETFTDQ